MAPKLIVRDDLPAVREHVFVRIPRADDLEIHVKLTDVDGERFVNIREFVPSLSWYGRGITIPALKELGDLMIPALVEAFDVS